MPKLIIEIEVELHIKSWVLDPNRYGCFNTPLTTFSSDLKRDPDYIVEAWLWPQLSALAQCYRAINVPSLLAQVLTRLLYSAQTIQNLSCYFLGNEALGLLHRLRRSRSSRSRRLSGIWKIIHSVFLERYLYSSFLWFLCLFLI